MSTLTRMEPPEARAACAAAGSRLRGVLYIPNHPIPLHLPSPPTHLHTPHIHTSHELHDKEETARLQAGSVILDYVSVGEAAQHLRQRPCVQGRRSSARAPTTPCSANTPAACCYPEPRAPDHLDSWQHQAETMVHAALDVHLSLNTGTAGTAGTGTKRTWTSLWKSERSRAEGASARTRFTATSSTPFIMA